MLWPVAMTNLIFKQFVCFDTIIMWTLRSPRTHHQLSSLPQRHIVAWCFQTQIWAMDLLLHTHTQAHDLGQCFQHGPWFPNSKPIASFLQEGAGKRGYTPNITFRHLQGCRKLRSKARESKLVYDIFPSRTGKSVAVLAAAIKHLPHGRGARRKSTSEVEPWSSEVSGWLPAPPRGVPNCVHGLYGTPTGSLVTLLTTAVKTCINASSTWGGERESKLVFYAVNQCGYISVINERERETAALNWLVGSWNFV